MKFLKNNNQGYVLAVILIIGVVLLSIGYHLYDQLVFSNKMTNRSMLKTQLDLHNISIADTTQTILNAVVTKQGRKVTLFSKGYTQGCEYIIRGECIGTKNIFDYLIANTENFPPYVKEVYTGQDANNNLRFNFKYCNFINTTIYDSVFDGNSLLQNASCDESDKIISQVTVRGSRDDGKDTVIISVRSNLPNKSPYDGISASSSFYIKLPPQYTDCTEYIRFDENNNELAFKSVDSTITLPGLNIDGSIPYGFLISRYMFIPDAQPRGNNEYGGSFTVYTHRSSPNRFTSYMYSSSTLNSDGFPEVYMLVPKPGNENFWKEPREYADCNEKYPVLGGEEPSKECGSTNGVIHSMSLNGGTGWTDRHTFDVVYNINDSSCTITRTTTSGLIPGVRHGGCFDENTLVEDNLGKNIKIKNLTMGQALKNPVTNEIVRVLKTVAGPEVKDLIEIVTKDNNSILVTQDHPVKTKKGLIRADQLTRNDLLFNENGIVKIYSIKKIPSNNRMVYNFMVSSDKDTNSDDDHYILANGIISGDLYLQNKLKHKNSLVTK